MDRNLDAVYFRVKRNEKFESVCFSDMTKEERDEVMDGKSEKWLKNLCQILADTIKSIGDTCDIIGGNSVED